MVASIEGEFIVTSQMEDAAPTDSVMTIVALPLFLVFFLAMGAVYLAAKLARTVLG